MLKKFKRFVKSGLPLGDDVDKLLPRGMDRGMIRDAMGLTDAMVRRLAYLYVALYNGYLLYGANDSM